MTWVSQGRGTTRRGLWCGSRSVASASTTTSIEALSAPASPHCDEMHPTAALNPPLPPPLPLPPLQQHQQQWQRPRASQPPPPPPPPPLRRKAISSHIAGTGAFLVVYDQPAHGAGDGASRSIG